jgi:hypothetical protein
MNRRGLLAVVVVSMAVVFVSPVAYAASGQAARNTGCGLGTMVWEHKADDSSLYQSSQMSTNQTYSQSIGIAMGTSQCTQPKAYVSNDRINSFVLANMDNLAKDIAQGRGESLDTFAELLNIPVEQRAKFYQKLQANFAKVFTSEQIQLNDVVDNAVTVAAAK